VQGHFVLSILIVLDALVLHRRAGEARPGPYRLTVPAELRRWSQALVAWGLLVIVTGTVVTGSGPHGGDEDAPRFGFAIGDVARIHGIAVVLFLAATLALVYRAHRLGSWSRLATPLTLLVWTIVVQGAIGYAQYFSDVPALLVGFHVAGSVLVWAAAVELTFATRAPIGQTEAAPSEASEPSLAATS
jgi:cytochrome c oxidase assembly protein subunit 15